MDHHQNYKKYRSQLRQSGCPCLPYLGVIRRDITMIHIGNENIISGAYLNFEKGKLLWDVLHNVNTWQKTPFQYHKNPPLFNALSNLFTYNEEMLYKYSLEWEPSEAQIFDE